MGVVAALFERLPKAQEDAFKPGWPGHLEFEELAFVLITELLSGNPDVARQLVIADGLPCIALAMRNHFGNPPMVGAAVTVLHAAVPLSESLAKGVATDE